MGADGPARRYYAALVGAWSGRLSLRVARPEGLTGQPMSTRALALFARLDGRLTLSTTLAQAGDSSFAHTTRVTKWGLLLFRSEETIVLGDDGRSFRMIGVQTQRLRAPEPLEGDGEIDEPADAALYRLQWAGLPMIQRTRVVPEGLELTQSTAWSEASALLRRLPGR